jgi:curved DNA-binding protein CbpA
MASEFYEQLGVDRAASSARIRSAYGQAVARLSKRRRAMVAQGGDSAQMDLLRARLDEAWDVLSDPMRRRRYDAMLAWTEGSRPRESEAVWAEVSGALAPPAAAVAARLLRAVSKLSHIGDLPLSPSGASDEPPTLVPHEEDLTQAPARLNAGSTAGAIEPPTATTMPRISIASPARRDDLDLKIVDGSPGASDVLLLQPRGPRTDPARSGLSADLVASLVDEHGYGGTLLRAVRERLGLSFQDVSDHTRISVRYLEALEDEALESLPSATFVRGYVREVARMLQLDADSVAAGYMRKLE